MPAGESTSVICRRRSSRRSTIRNGGRLLCRMPGMRTKHLQNLYTNIVPTWFGIAKRLCYPMMFHRKKCFWNRSEEHTSELQSRENLVCRLLLEKKNKKTTNTCKKYRAM